MSAWVECHKCGKRLTVGGARQWNAMLIHMEGCGGVPILNKPSAEPIHGQLASQVPAPVTRKYRNQPTEYAGHRYDSKAEATFAMELDARLAAHEIMAWTRQVPFTILGGTVYRVDFMIFSQAGIGSGMRVLAELVEIKGMVTPEAKIKMKALMAMGMPLKVIRRKGNRWEQVRI